MEDERPKFFTWVEEKYDHPMEVPKRLRGYIRTLFLEGKTVQMLALATNLPEDWVEIFAHEDPEENKPN